METLMNWIKPPASLRRVFHKLTVFDKDIDGGIHVCCFEFQNGRNQNYFHFANLQLPKLHRRQKKTVIFRLWKGQKSRESFVMDTCLLTLDFFKVMTE